MTEDGCGYKNEDNLRDMYHSGYDMRDIASEFDIAVGTVQYWMDKYNIDRNGGSAGYNHAKYSVNKGYPRWNTNGEYLFIHRLLAIAKYGFENVVGKQVHHKNGVRWDNRPSNIEVMDESSHMSYHWSGENNPQSKLSRSDIDKIKERYFQGDVSQSDLATEYGVDPSHISRILNDKRWE